MMIKRILIHNSPAFKDIELTFEGGFHVFSGASGSGKSVFMESLLAICGIKESNADLIEANIDFNSIQFDWLENGVPHEDENDEVVLSILKKEKTRYFLNHASSSKKKLYEIVSGFARHISTKGADELKEQNILRVLDCFISTRIPTHAKNLALFQQNFSRLFESRQALKQIEEDEKNITSLKEFAAFEIAKIESLHPREGEYEELLELKKTLSKQEKIREQIVKVREALALSESFEGFLSLVDMSCPNLMEGLSEIEAIVDSKEEQLSELEDINPEEMLDKIAALSELNRRFGSINAALSYLEEQKQKLAHYENLSFDKARLQKCVSEYEEECENLAHVLHKTRSEHISSFEQALCEFCVTLKLQNLSATLSQVPMNSYGMSACELQLGTSRVDTLSSGEYNRLRLAFMCLDAQLEPRRGVLVLDEIDANLSGEESEGVAVILKTLSCNYQIFAISHQIHMPSLADHHYLVKKTGDTSTIIELDYEGRVQEIARMISGANITQQALDFAKSHLQS